MSVNFNPLFHSNRSNGTKTAARPTDPSAQENVSTAAAAKSPSETTVQMLARVQREACTPSSQAEAMTKNALSIRDVRSNLALAGLDLGEAHTAFLMAMTPGSEYIPENTDTSRIG